MIPEPPTPNRKPGLLVVILWGLGDLVLATPFLRAASEKFEVTLLAKPHALELGARLWPSVDVVSFVAPWTAFHGKYRWWNWPWLKMAALRSALRARHFEVAVSARHDPRDHLLMFFVHTPRRIGFPRLGSQRFLTHPLAPPAAAAHRSEHWKIVARQLGLTLPPSLRFTVLPEQGRLRTLLIHTGAAQLIRSWPLDRYQRLCRKLREAGFTVHVACDPGQREWWLKAGEKEVSTPVHVDELCALLGTVRAFIGNDSGPGHIAAALGLPTFTIFGPQLPEWFAPMSPRAQWIDGKPCPYKPCSDYCHFPVAYCLEWTTEDEVWSRVTKFVSGVGEDAGVIPHHNQLQR
jgi:heptosyltransferase-2